MIFYIHGWHKLEGWISYLQHGTPWKLVEEVAGMHFPAPLASAVAATLVQFICSLFIVVGLKSKWNVRQPSEHVRQCQLCVARGVPKPLRAFSNVRPRDVLREHQYLFNFFRDGVRKEIEEDQNTALGIILGAFILGVSLIISAAIRG